MSVHIIPLPSGPPSAGALLTHVRVAAGEAPQQLQTPIGLLTAVQASERVALVPAHRLSWHKVLLPKGTLDRSLLADGQGQRLRAVLGGLLEDELLDEPETLHLALQPQARTAEPVWVAACDRHWLRTWLNALEQAGLLITRIVPESAPSDTRSDMAAPAMLYAHNGEHQPQLLWTHAQGVLVLPLSADSVALLRPQLANAVSTGFRAEPAVAGLAEDLFQTPCQLLTRTEAWAQAANSHWDLAQFDLLRTRGARTRQSVKGLLDQLRTSPVWRPARWAGVALILANVVGLQAWAWREQAALNQQRSALRNVLTTTFPDIQVVVDAPVQMARAVADLRRSSGQASKADLESMLGHVQSAGPNFPVPTRISYQNKVLHLTGLPAASTADPAFVQGLQTRGYSVHADGDALVIQTVAQP